jgi:hypothetical protein
MRQNVGEELLIDRVGSEASWHAPVAAHAMATDCRMPAADPIVSGCNAYLCALRVLSGENSRQVARQ